MSARDLHIRSLLAYFWGVGLSMHSQRESLILKYYPLVASVARKMATKYPDTVDIDDLISIGTLGLIDAADRYDPAKNVHFGSYARIRIKGAIVDALRRQDWVPRSTRGRQKEYSQIEHSLEQQLQRKPTSEELRKYIEEKSHESYEVLRKESVVQKLVSTEEKRLETEQRLGDTLPSPLPNTEELALQNRLRRNISAVLNLLPERDQQIVQLYYFESKSLRDVGKILGITESRVCQLHQRVRRRIKETITANNLNVAA